jgi:WD40 repeat protein
VSPNTRLLATGAADNNIKLWNIKTGECVKTWEVPTAVKRVEFSEDGSRLLAVTEKRMGYLGTIVVYEIRYGEDLSDQADEHSLRIECERSKATVAAWSYLDKFIIAGHEDGTVSQYDSKVNSLSTFGVLLLTFVTRAEKCFLMLMFMMMDTKSMIFRCHKIGLTLSQQAKTSKRRYDMNTEAPW